MVEWVCYLCPLLHPLAMTDFLRRGKKWLVEDGGVGREEHCPGGERTGGDYLCVCALVW